MRVIHEKEGVVSKYPDGFVPVAAEQKESMDSDVDVDWKSKFLESKQERTKLTERILQIKIKIKESKQERTKLTERICFLEGHSKMDKKTKDLTALTETNNLKRSSNNMDEEEERMKRFKRKAENEASWKNQRL